MTEYVERLRSAQERCLNGVALTREEIVYLLQTPLGSEQDRLLRRAARQVARETAGNLGYIWTALGLDFQPCAMNCKFCALGEAWGLATQASALTEEEILEKARALVRDGSDFVVLRTTEFYSAEALCALVRRIRRDIPGGYRIVLNTGELEVEQANALHESGADAVYHALRLREGVDTPFRPAERLATMEHVQRSRLELVSLVEPVGCEHTNEELADSFLNLVAHGAYISGAMARVPVQGTPFGRTERLSDGRLAQIIAVLRLSGGGTVRDICVHPASAEALDSGANVVVVEMGAIPRDARLSPGAWRDFTMREAKNRLQAAGYRLHALQKNDKPV